jgi:hypothetical protein
MMAGCRRLRVDYDRFSAFAMLACEPRASEGRLPPQGEGRWMTKGQGELRFDSETQTRNEQNQVRASLERLCERLAEW